MKQNGRFIFYHRTNAHNAHAIIESGFRNSTGHFLNNRIWTGAWLSSIPVDSEQGAADDALLLVKLDIDDRELARWEWAAEGRTYTEIAAALGIRPSTVETHRAHLMQKLGLRTKTDLIRYALRRGILPMET